MSIYPNPTDGFLTIEFDHLSKGVLRVFGPAGRLVYNQEVDNINNVDLGLDGKLGLYLVQFVDSDGEVFLDRVLKVD